VLPSLTDTDERARLGALRRVKILDTPRERRFDDLVELAAQVCGTPMAVLNLVDADRQWGKAMVGFADTEEPRSVSFCARTIEQDAGLMVVPDTREDPRFADNPLVTGDPNLRFYAGASVVDREGYRLGSVCVVDTRPRTLDDGQLRALEALARAAMAQMELRLTLEVEREEVRKLRDLDRVRDQFISTVSHELRTPLTSIRGWIDLLLEEPERLEADQLDAIQRIDRNTSRLGRLLDDLLDLTRADAGALSIRREHVDLADLTRDGVAALASGARSGMLGVRASVPASVPVLGDAERLAQVIDNLCSNAVKYTPDGGTIAIELEARAGQAELRVVDNGIGIPIGERDLLFERFFRASTATESDIPGSGLGLAISKAIIERHGGTIAVGDGEDGGTAFVVRLPLA
jgi:signal transduction histidine kinase